jgi:hypothetical protein
LSLEFTLEVLYQSLFKNCTFEIANGNEHPHVYCVYCRSADEI